jgi:putative (di)nucleoside polyphosphate hydrolase
MKKWKTGKRAYRRGVGAVLFNAEGLVFVGQRIDRQDPAWQLPQGGIGKSESPRQAVLRELAEEIGTDRATIIGESRDWFCYDLPNDVAETVWRGRYRGQTQKWFALRFTGHSEDIDLSASRHPEFSAWKWIRLEALPGLIVPFKRGVYERVVAEFQHLATPVDPTERS